jgi:ketosteroid isomerase-like protein
MSQENVEAVRAALTRYRVPMDPGDVDALVEAFDPQGEAVDPPDLPGATTHRGHDAIRRAVESLPRFWVDWRMEADEVASVGNDRVFAHGRAFGRGRASGVEVVRPFQLVAVLKDGRLMQVRYFESRNEALEAAGLRE